MASDDPLRELLDVSLMEAMFTRRARRFGPGVEIPAGPYTVRFTGRTAPTEAGVGTPVLFFTDDAGVMPVGDTSDERLGALAILLGNGTAATRRRARRTTSTSRAPRRRRATTAAARDRRP